MKANKSVLLCGAAIAALGLAASPAAAFDEVDWHWDLEVIEHVTKDVDIDVDIDPVGLVLLEDLQIYIGDVTAESYVNGVYNNQPNEGGGMASGTIDFTVTLDGMTDDETDPSTVSGVADLGGDLMGSSSDVSGTLDEGTDDLDVVMAFEDIPVENIEIEPTGSFDALTELPEVVSTATAIANNVSIDSDVMVEIHEGQYVFNTGEFGDDSNLFSVPGLPGGDGPTLTSIEDGQDFGNNRNEFHDAAAILTLAALFNVIEPSEISAVSQVDDILNASVDSAATAVANNKAITVDAKVADDAVVMGDITQFAYANTSALSRVGTNFCEFDCFGAQPYGVEVNNYTNLGQLDRPLVSSVATAVGNNLSITVSTPEIGGGGGE
ncbi:MAG TPA: hypothetical protein EYH07_16170 [Kiloniellaceae bacterium]|nr:hypothetical protein [Kiloniellaceae bacterium]HIP79983.1 hypothetical protein [Kiloniellaceae bacterium]